MDGKEVIKVELGLFLLAATSASGPTPEESISVWCLFWLAPGFNEISDVSVWIGTLPVICGRSGCWPVALPVPLGWVVVSFSANDDSAIPLASLVAAASMALRVRHVSASLEVVLFFVLFCREEVVGFDFFGCEGCLVPFAFLFPISVKLAGVTINNSRIF